MSGLSGVVGHLGFASGSTGTRKLWALAGAGFLIMASFIALVVYRTESIPTIMPKIPATQTGVGVSGSDQQRRAKVQETEAAEAQRAHAAGTSALMTVEDSHLGALRHVRETAAIRTREAPQTAVASRAVPNEDMTRAWLAAMDSAMGAMRSGFEVTENFNANDLRKLRAEERAAAQKAAASSAGANAGAANKQGLGLAGQRVMATTVLAATMEPDSNGNTPAVVQMTSGPLAGYRLHGIIDKKNDALTIPMDTLYYKNQTVPVKAVLVSPQTQEVTVACDVDHHYLVRVGVPALAGAVQGLGQAAQESGSTFAAGPFGSAGSYSRFSPWQIAGTAAGGAATGAQNILRDVLPKGSTVTLCADVPVEVFFEDDVYLPAQNP